MPSAPPRQPIVCEKRVADSKHEREFDEGKVVHYAIADKRVMKLLDQAEDLLLQVGPLSEACPRYRRPMRAGQRARRQGR